MLKLEDQVCSLELAKHLKELEVKQISLFYYCRRLTGRHNETEIILLINTETKIDELSKYSAFSISELLDKLLASINGTPFQLLKGYDLESGILYSARYYNQDIIIPDKNPVNACAKMLIYLIENNLIKVKD